MGGGGGDTEVKETAYEKEIARIATEEWARAEEVFKPLEDKWIAGVVADPAAEKEKISGVVAGRVGTEYDEAQAELDKQRLASGMDVGSGTFKRSLSRGEDVGKAVSRGKIGVTAGKTGKLMSAINIGRGQATEAQASMSDIARQSTEDAMRSTRDKYIASRETGEMIGTGVGMLTRGYLDDNKEV